MYILQVKYLLRCREPEEAAYLSAIKGTHPQRKEPLISARRSLPNCHRIHWLLGHDKYVRPFEVMNVVLLSVNRE